MKSQLFACTELQNRTKILHTYLQWINAIVDDKSLTDEEIIKLLTRHTKMVSQAIKNGGY